MAGGSGTGRRRRATRWVSIALMLAMLGGLIAGFAGGHLPGATGAQAAQDVPSGDVIVVLNRSVNPRQVARAANILPDYVFTNVLNGFSANLPAAAVEALLRNPNVLLVSPDIPMSIAAQTLPSGVDRIDADQNPTAAIDGVDQRVDADVAVVDTGISSHPDLNLVGGVDCSGSGSYADSNGHGTHVAGTIGALDNDSGVVGVAPGARLWAVRVFNSAGNGTTSTIVCGLDWVVANAGVVDVVNMSIVGDGLDGACGSSALHQAICNTVSAGVTVVAAAGNAGVSAAGTVPATYDEVITVSAFTDYNGRPGGAGIGACSNGNPDDTFASYSNWGGDIDIAAPGTCILSTAIGGGTRYMSGTSMAAPHVTGAVALYRAQNPGASPAAVRAWLLATAQPQGSAFGFTGDPDGIAEPVLSLGDGIVSPTPTATATSTATSTATVTATATATSTATGTATPTLTVTPTNTPTATSTALPSPTNTPVPTNTPTPLPTNTPTPRPTNTPVPTATPTNTPTPVPTSTPSPTPTTGVTGNPAITLSSTRGTVNANLRVTITGFPANSAVAVQWNGVTKQTVTTSASGEALASFKVPAAPMGTYTVRAVAGSRSASDAYTIVPRIKVIPGEAATGATVDISLRGYAARESVRIRWLNGSSWVTLATVTTSGTGSANVDVAVPSWAPQGLQKVRGDGSSGRAQTNAFVVSGTQIAAASVETPAPETPLPVTPTPRPPDEPAAVPTEAPAVPEATPYPIANSTQTDNAVAAWVIHDGDPASFWATNTEPAPERAWAVLDLGAVLPIGEIRWLLTLPDPTGSLIIRVSEDGEGWMTLPAPMDGEAGVWHGVTANVSARFVRFTFVDTGQSAILGGLAEAEIWPADGPIVPPVIDPALPDPDQPPVEDAVAPASAGPIPVLASESSDPGAAAWVVHDGDPGSSWVTTTDAPAEASITLDLGAAQPVSVIRCLFATGGLGDTMQVLISSDGGTWSLAGDVGTEAGVWQEAWIGAEARYIRLLFPNPAGYPQLGGLAEVEIWP